MLASLLYNTNQITNIQVKNVEYFDLKIVFEVKFQPENSSCPTCGCTHYNWDGFKERKLRMVPLGNKASFLHMEIHRHKCTNCARVWWPPIPFVNGKKRVTISFERYVISMMQFATIKHVANFVGVSWGQVKNLHKDYLKRTCTKIDYESLQYIGVDEFSIRKGHQYMTIFINLKSGEIFHAIEGKSIEKVRPILTELACKAKNLKAIAMDMNAAYASAVNLFLPGIDVVYDRFHVMGLLNKTLEEIRRSQQNKCNQIGVKVLKGQRFLLLSNYENLNPKKQSSLNALFEVNSPLLMAHTMKEQIRLFWTKFSLQEGCKFLGWWIIDAFETGIEELTKTGKTLLRYWKGLTNYFNHRITNGKTEGINNKIKTMKRQAYGFRDMEYFKLRLYNLHIINHSFL